ncbi:DUF244 domain-containing protein, partial [Borreliella garinii]
NHRNYRFKQFVFNYDPKKKAIADRFKELTSINIKSWFKLHLSFVTL